jgi:hypothetical protein
MAPFELSDFTFRGTPLPEEAKDFDLLDDDIDTDLTFYLVDQLRQSKFNDVRWAVEKDKVSYGNLHCDTT